MNKPTRTQYAKSPLYVEIETTIMCNATCWFCPQKNTLRGPKYMEEWVWKKIIDDTRGIGAIYRPFLLNEPFADKRMPKVVEYIKQDPTAKVEFNTNASMLTPKMTDKMLDLGIDVMRFSVDGLYKSTFDESRGISYDKVYKHVNYFLEQVKERKMDVQTEVRMIKLPGTDQEQIEFKEYWQQRNPDNILFTDLYSYPWENQTESTNIPCLKIENELFFYVDGTATLCCWDAEARQIIGDVKTENALDIWNGQEMNRCRNLLDAGKRDELTLCSRCDAYTNTDFSDWEGFDYEAYKKTAKTHKIIPIIKDLSGTKTSTPEKDLPKKQPEDTTTAE